ncbi:hypothetical protein [Neisseria bergeri]|nr:hypothetical protein [Neisseria bergeri]
MPSERKDNNAILREKPSGRQRGAETQGFGRQTPRRLQTALFQQVF